jgi:CheY-like chemotaxis protein
LSQSLSKEIPIRQSLHLSEPDAELALATLLTPLNNHAQNFLPVMTILVADDKSDERLTLVEALRSAGVHADIQELDDGARALDYLQANGEFTDRSRYPLPDLIFLDLLMPGKSGLDVLAWLKSQPQLSSIPTVVLTGFPVAGTITRAYELGAKTFFLKPVQATELKTLFAALRAD